MRARFASIAAALLLASCASAPPAQRDVTDAETDATRDVATSNDAPPVCPPDRPMRCLGECVDDTDTNPLRCGSACLACPTDARGTVSCTAGVCSLECDSGFVRDANTCVPEPGPRPVRPLANARVSVQRPLLRWTSPPAITAVRIAICRDRACTQVEHEFDATGSSVRVPAPLPRGVWFWNLRAIEGGAPRIHRSATWSFRTPATDGLVEWSVADRFDFDGDGTDDLLLDCYQPMPGRTLIYRGNAQGELQPVIVWNDLARAIGDVDGDGFTDLQARGGLDSEILLGGPDMAMIRVLQRFEPSDTHGGLAGLSEYDTAIGDVDRDGYADALLEERSRGWLGYGSSRGWALPMADLGVDVDSIAFDLDADDFDDVLAGGPLWWRGSATRPIAPTVFAMKNSMSVIPVGDLDGDGYLDAVEFDADHIALIRGSASGPIVGEVRPLATEGQRSFVGRYGDFDGDGREDLVFRTVGVPITQPYSVLLGAADGYDAARTVAPTSLPCPPRMLWGVRTIGDFDADGVVDRLVACDDERLFVQPSRTVDGAWTEVPLPEGVIGCLAN